MYLSYDDFLSILESKIQTGEELYDSILRKVIDYPNRYCGLFRLSNAKSKLVQNITQSNEIKFGDIFEDLVDQYFAKLGYTLLPKNLGKDSRGKKLVADQLFTSNEKLFFIEQKIRDDHDSTKKQGQFNNFEYKITQLKHLYDKDLVAIMWFIDDSMTKNKRFYLEELPKLNLNSSDETHLFYGEELFEYLERKDVWREILTHLRMFRNQMGEEVIQIPDFGTSQEIYDALLRLDNRRWEKLNSNTEIYNQLRKDLFSSGENLKKAHKTDKGAK